MNLLTSYLSLVLLLSISVTWTDLVLSVLSAPLELCGL